jgi:ribose-phosphate pyrophosphokinase
MHEPLVFSIASYDPLADAIAKGAGWERGHVTRKQFPDGERYLRIETDPADRDVIIVGGTVDDPTTLELYDLACGCVSGGAYRLRMVIPFFGYSTMERSVRHGEVVTAKTRARVLSSIPMASRGTQVFLLDLHVDAIANYFEGGMRAIHVYGKQLVIEAARRLAPQGLVLASTDAGRAKWVESLANDLQCDVAFVYKKRISGEQTEITGVSAQVAGKHVVIYDDMIRTGGSLLAAAEAYRDAGAARIDAIATHGVFPNDSLARLRASGLFGSIAVTDSHPRAVALQDDFLQVSSTAHLLVEHLRSNR